MTPPPQTTSRADALDARCTGAFAGKSTIGAWQLAGLIAEGPRTCVYRARPAECPADGPADYAVKVLRRELEDDRLAVESIQREALIGRRVVHPHLVSVLHAVVEKPPYHTVMPYLDGATLSQALTVKERLSVPFALWVTRQIAEALGALHENGWIHGDLKPANILLSSGGHATLLDLGFTRRIESPGNIVDRPLLGTLHYVPPELITSTLKADGRSDFYSLGITLYQMLTGRLPFATDDVGQLVTLHLQGVPPEPRRFRPQLPHHVCRLLREMLAKEPLRRPHSAEELVSRLAELEIDTFDDRFAA